MLNVLNVISNPQYILQNFEGKHLPSPHKYTEEMSLLLPKVNKKEGWTQLQQPKLHNPHHSILTVLAYLWNSRVLGTYFHVDINVRRGHWDWVSHSTFLIIPSNFPSPPDMLLSSCFEYMSCTCVAFFTRFALTHAGSYPFHVSCQKLASFQL